MSDPNDPWAIRPDAWAPESGEESDQPTEHLHTTDPNAAYGRGPNATLAYPTYESLLEQQAQQPPYDRPPWPRDAGQPMPPSPPGRHGIVMPIGMGIALGFLIAVVVAGGFLLLRPHNSGSTGNNSTGALPSRDTTAQPALPWGTTESPDGRSPNLRTPLVMPAPDTNYGGTVGSVNANDGATLWVRNMLGDRTAVVHTNDLTKVLGVHREKVSDLKVGDMVIVQGDKAGDGSITARLIISTSLGN